MTMQEAEQVGRRAAARVREAGGTTEQILDAYYAAMATAFITPKEPTQ